MNNLRENLPYTFYLKYPLLTPKAPLILLNVFLIHDLLSDYID